MIERVNRNKLKYSANRTVEVFGELTDQMHLNCDDASHLKSPSNNKSLRLDSFMSVFKVNYNNHVES